MVDIAPSEMRVMRSIFQLFDEAGSGSIQAKDLQRLHIKLGEPITDEEAEAGLVPPRCYEEA